MTIAATTDRNDVLPTAAMSETAPPRVAIEVARPVVDQGRFAAKASVAEPVTVVADVFADGHERLAAAATFRQSVTGTEVTVPLVAVGNDRWSAQAVLNEVGPWTFTVVGWIDPWEYWRHSILARHEAGLDISVELGDGLGLLERAGQAGDPVERLRGADVSVALDDNLAATMASWASTLDGLAVSAAYPLHVARARAAHGAWYELFPRSLADGGETANPDTRSHGTLVDLVDRLDYVADLGFQVLYLPPIHPIGLTARKGPENSLVAGPHDPGSPWAIGGSAGGHTAIHPDLGTFGDFDRVVARADELGLEIALDLAFQCAPEHPWVTEHPDWFAHRSDGSIRTAENPPKRYEDIYPIDFTTDDWQALWAELANVVRCWVSHGVRIFRVDNPHTKPFAFWEWMIAEIRSETPDVIFLAEAFTRPRVAERLGKLGFDQSYGYFTWKREAWELTEYFGDMSKRTLDYLRTNVWPNTPDILTDQLQSGGRAMFEARLILASMISANWGVYGPAYELGESAAVRTPGEDYARSEKYEVRHWELTHPDSLAPLMRRLNIIRSHHPALHTDQYRVLHPCDDPGLFCFSKQNHDRSDTVIVIVNVAADMHRSGLVHLNLEALGLEADQPFDVEDLLADATYHWQGSDNYVSLDPHGPIAHILRVVR